MSDNEVKLPPTNPPRKVLSQSQITNIWLIYVVLILSTYLVMRKLKIRSLSAMIVGIVVGAIYLLGQLTFEDLATEKSPMNLAVVATFIIIVFYLASCLAGDRED